MNLSSIGFPASILAVILAGIGVWRKIFWLPVLAALLSLPIGFYLQGSSDLGLLVWLVPLSLLGAAYSLRRENTRLAWILLLPALLLFLMLLIALAAFLNLRG
jgi:hypothetical protein